MATKANQLDPELLKREGHKRGWSVVYEKALRDDGSLFFPERLTKEFLEKARRTMGSYIYANQYQNEIIPEGDQTFREEWFKYYSELPSPLHTFAFIDPAISTADTADYTGVAVVSLDVAQNWYVRYASRMRINPTQLIDLCFKIHDRYQPGVIGIEDVAFQRSLIHFAHEEMKRRGRHIPIAGIKHGPEKTKEMRILSLVPRFEWGTILLAPGLSELEMELLQFPRGTHDDVIDALCSIESIAFTPQSKRKNDEPQSPHDPRYESWYIRKLIRERAQG